MSVEFRIELFRIRRFPKISKAKIKRALRVGFFFFGIHIYGIIVDETFGNKLCPKENVTYSRGLLPSENSSHNVLLGRDGYQ